MLKVITYWKDENKWIKDDEYSFDEFVRNNLSFTSEGQIERLTTELSILMEVIQRLIKILFNKKILDEEGFFNILDVYQDEGFKIELVEIDKK